MCNGFLFVIAAWLILCNRDNDEYECNHNHSGCGNWNCNNNWNYSRNNGCRCNNGCEVAENDNDDCNRVRVVRNNCNCQ